MTSPASGVVLAVWAVPVAFGVQCRALGVVAVVAAIAVAAVAEHRQWRRHRRRDG